MHLSKNCPWKMNVTPVAKRLGVSKHCGIHFSTPRTGFQLDLKVIGWLFTVNIMYPNTVQCVTFLFCYSIKYVEFTKKPGFRFPYKNRYLVASYIFCNKIKQFLSGTAFGDSIKSSSITSLSRRLFCRQCFIFYP